MSTADETACCSKAELWKSSQKRSCQPRKHSGSLIAWVRPRSHGFFSSRAIACASVSPTFWAACVTRSRQCASPAFHYRFFSATVGKADLEFCVGQSIHKAACMRMHRFRFAGFKVIFENAYLIIVDEHLVILGRCLYWVLCVCRPAQDDQD